MLAECRPANLKIVVLQNGCYETTGCQPTANGFDVDFAALARGVGLSSAETIDHPNDLTPAIDRLLQFDGLSLLVVHVDTDWQPYGGAPEWSIGEEKHQFQLRLSAERAMAKGVAPA
jgi:thiamine pyrophosphate-dependent acetolactate synthase large subunit-like protein